MKKTVFIIPILSFCLFLTGCNHDKEILEFFDEFDAVTFELVEKIKSGDVGGARALLDSKKESLRRGWRKIPRSRSHVYMSEAVKRRYDASFYQNLEAVKTAAQILGSRFENDQPRRQELQNLVTEFKEIFRTNY